MVQRKLAKGKRIHTKKWQRCVKKVKAKSKKVNPYAVCTESMGYRKSILKPFRRKSRDAIDRWMG